MKRIVATLQDLQQIWEQQFSSDEALQQWLEEHLGVICLGAEELWDDDDPVWVNVYHVSFERGGCEEGGWYYDRYSLVESVHLPYAEARTFAARKRAEYGEPDRPYHSVLGGWRYEVRIEEASGASITCAIPQYA